MKKVMVWGLLLILSFNLALAENLYQYDSLQLQLGVSGRFDLISAGMNPEIESAKVQLLLFPKDSFRQKILGFDTLGEKTEEEIIFTWDSPILGQKDFSYTSLVQTWNERTEVKDKISFPLNNNINLNKYLQPAETIDSDNPKIIAKAAELAEGEDDAFKVAFNLANWVGENVKYDLNTLTASASQKASWVLENKEGVCDEMTSLFIAMCRSLGIPARFISGISYSTSELFEEPWQPHGWAEVYFPDYGWVAFDIAFGEYGYIDVTHVQLRESGDPKESSTLYEWQANNVNLESDNLNFEVRIKDKGKIIEDEIQLEMEIIAPEVKFGSYNLIKGILKNKEEYYATATLQAAFPEEIEIIGKNRRTILLRPKEIRETHWIIKVPENFNPNYVYSFPVVIYSEKNISTGDVFFSQRRSNTYYSLEEMQALIPREKDKTYSRKVAIDCIYESEIELNASNKIECKFKNSGNANLRQAKFCLGEICEIKDLLISQRVNFSINLDTRKVGNNKILVSAENELIEKKSFMEYLVYDQPKIKLNYTLPAEIYYKDVFWLNLSLSPDSYSFPQKVKIGLGGQGERKVVEISEINEEQGLVFELKGDKLSRSNKLKLDLSWEDQKGGKYRQTKEIIFSALPRTFWDKVKMAINGLLQPFYS